MAYVELRNIDKRDDGCIYITNKFGYVASIPAECEEELGRYALLPELDAGAPEFISQLADAGLLTFTNYEPKEHYLFDDALLNHHGEEPIYPGPVISHLAITNHCNMGCKYCSVRDMHDAIDDALSIEEYKKIIDILAKSGTFQIGLTGGEPTLVDGIEELVSHIADKGIACNITTNGWDVSDEKIDALVAAGLTQCQVSLDSHIAKVHDGSRTRGSHARALDTARRLMDKGLIVGVDCVVSKSNIGHIEEFIEFLEENGFLGLTLIKLKQGHLSREEFEALSVDYDEYAALIDRVCRRDSPMEITVDCASVSNLCKTLSDEEIGMLHSAGCPAGHTLISIAPNGDAYPCAALTAPQFKLGNVLSDSFDDIWDGSPLLRKVRNIKENVAGICKACDKLDICRAGCRGVSHTLSGDMLASDASCSYIRREA